MEDEYEEKKDTMKLGFSEFQNVLDDHIKEMDIRKKNNKFEESDALDTTSSNCKKKSGKKNKEEGEFDNMLKNMMNLSEDEDEVLGETQLIKTDKRQKAANNLIGDNYEMVTKWKNGTEYESQTFTSSAGGKLIINTIKKTSKKGKRKYKQNKDEEEKENIPKTIVPIKEDILEHMPEDNNLEEGDEIEEIEEEEFVEEEGEEYNPDEDNWSENCDKESGHISEEEEDEYSEEDSYSDLPKFERQLKKDAKRPDYIDGMKVLKIEHTPQLAFEEDTALQNMIDPDRVEPESDDEDYALGTTNRIKVKGKIMLSAEAINDQFIANKKDLSQLNIVKEKKAEIRKKKIVLVDKYKNEEKDQNKEIDEELLEQEREEKIEKIKGLKRRGEKLTAEEKKERKEVLKELKNERKEKKQKFKHKFDENIKHAGKKIKEQKNNEGNLQGVSVVKIH